MAEVTYVGPLALPLSVHTSTGTVTVTAPVVDVDDAVVSELVATGEFTVDTPAAARGTVAAVKEWVGDDPRRAREALDVELSSSSPRSTLVDHLHNLVPQED